MSDKQVTIKMIEIQKLEEITSKEHLDKALKAAKIWCQMHLSKHIQNFQDKFNYEIFHYIIDNEMIGPDMCLDKQNNGLIRVSTRKLRWYQEREKYFKEHEMIRYARIGDKNIKIKGDVEIDPESMFVHEITEFIVTKIPEIFFFYFSKMEFPHPLAYKIENINRKERDLKIWPYAQ